MKPNSQIVQINDLTFREYISEEQLQKRIKELASEIDISLQGKETIFLGILNGCFVFMADLVRYCNSDQEIRFIKLASYEGKESSGKILMSGTLGEELGDRHIVLVEDIIDSGLTMVWIINKLHELKVASITIVTLLFKPSALKHEITIDHIGFEIPDDFVVGYGMDYMGKGRNLRSIYTLLKVQN